MPDQIFSAELERQAQRFDASQPIGFCVYCGASDVGLTDEHIAPEGLQGKTILKSASCGQCACLTSYSELRTLRGPLWAVREQFAWYGERKSDDRPTHLPLDILRKDWTIQKLMIPTAEYPLVFRMPRFPAPRFLRPPAPDDADFLRKVDYRQMDTADGMARLREILQATPDHDKPLLNMEIFEVSKVIAKIAYGYAIYFLGPYAIRPFVTDIIIAPRDHAPSFLHYVGGAFFGDNRIEELTTSYLGACRVRAEQHEGRTVILARVQLLGPIHGPVYEVVVGELMRPTKNRRRYVPTPSVSQKTYRQLLSESLGLIPSRKSAIP